MLSARGIRNACPRCRVTSALVSTRFYNHSAPLARPRSFAATQSVQSNKRRPITQAFSTSRCLRQEPTAEQPPSDNSASSQEIEQIVRDAKQRFRDTLPKGYLNDEEYALYERLYGPPLRETRPEDVGIDTHADMGSQAPRSDDEGTILKQLEGGEFEEISYKIPGAESEEVGEVELPQEIIEAAAQDLAQQTPGYIDLVARNQREYDAMHKLAKDFEESQKKLQEAEDAIAAEEEKAMEEEVAPYWPPEREYSSGERETGETRRFHPFTLEGKFHRGPVEITLPKDELVAPIRNLLERSHLEHVKTAAEKAFGGAGLPTSPVTPENQRNGNMRGVGLPADSRHMTEIEGDAFVAAFLPPAYASVMATLREVRKRVGSDWLQSRLKNGQAGISVLDAGSGGAGLVAWDQIVNAEWELLKEKGEVSGSQPPGKKTVVVGSDRLRHRVKTFLDNTTFLPRLPDYEHSGEMRGQHLDAGDQPQARKSYDVIIASHLFLKEEQDHYRQAILNNLWSLLNKDGGILIVLEKAHPRGFEAVAHVRDTVRKHFLLPQSGEPDLSPEEFNPAYHREREQGHIVAPCTNHGACPMYKTPGKSPGRKDFCHFSQRFVRPTFYSRMLGSTASNQGEVEFSYVAFQRGVPKASQLPGKVATDDAFAGYDALDRTPDMQTLPRMLLPALKRKGHVTIDVCTAEGKLERWTVTKSYSRLAYHDARKSGWGDLWALGAKTRVLRSARAGRGPDDGGKRAGLEGKKPRKVEVSMGPRGITADEKNAPRERRSKTKRDRRGDLLKELLLADKLEDAEIEKEVEAELDELNQEDDKRL